MNLFTRSTEPLKIALIIGSESSLMSLACVLDVMRGANRLAQTKLFDWQIYTPNNQAAVLTCGISIQPDAILNTQIQGDLLLILAGFNNEQHYDKTLLRQLHKLIPRFRFIGGIEAGSWVLARMGLLTNKKATTHWEDLEDFALRYPNVQVMPDRYVLDGNIFTTGGASPSFDFMLHLISSRYGQQLALEVASIFIYDTVHTGTDAQPLVSLGLLSQQEPRIAAAIRLMSERLDDPLSIKQLAAQLQLSIRLLEYLFREHLHCSPTQYYLHLRLQSARRLVTDTHLSMQEIALRTGFSSLATLSRAFREAYQLSPAPYRRRFKQNAAKSF
ncbi:GlxA family transcriptional regulator [Thiolinea disciformis]|uniref:GlxA family transcriptional regulator n=1 Tax=Thiolinea disciformis TaxID=125614 RepID=UPI000527CE5B|nr:GlxA family transcriptional regulator [Thiolinea disciformis]